MASKTLFSTLRGALAPKADSFNEAGGLAQLQQVLKLCEKVPTDFIARPALHCRQKGFALKV